MRDMGGQIAAMDTDSAMIVSTKHGGMVPCAGGTHKLANYQVGSGNAGIRALSFAQVMRRGISSSCGNSAFHIGHQRGSNSQPS